MAGYTYDTYTAALANLMAYQTTDASFIGIEPSIIDYAEQRIYRELDLLSTNVSDYSTTLSANNRQASISNSYVVTDIVNVLTPVGGTSTTGTRNPLVPVSREIINALWPSNTATVTPSVPTMFAMLDQWTILVAPPPDAAYGLEVIGTQRPAALSALNATTFLSERLPDLFLAASMVFASGWMRNFGAQASDPQMGTSWEQQYEKLLASAEVEEARKWKWGGSWTGYPVVPTAQPQRG